MKKSQEQVIDGLISNIKAELLVAKKKVKDAESFVAYLEKELRWLEGRKERASKE